MAKVTKHVREFMRIVAVCMPENPPQVDGRKIQKFHETVLHDYAGLSRPEDIVDEAPEPSVEKKKKPNKKKQKSQQSLPDSELAHHQVSDPDVEELM